MPIISSIFSVQVVKTLSKAPSFHRWLSWIPLNWQTAMHQFFVQLPKIPVHICPSPTKSFWVNRNES